MRTLLVSERERQGFTQQQIAEAIGISRSHYAMIECGYKDPSYKISVRIKRILCHLNDDIFFDKSVSKRDTNKIKKKNIKK